MIIFDLACSCGTQFEAWFQDHGDYVRQSNSRQLACPVCGGHDIHKILSPVAVHSNGRAARSGNSTPRGEVCVYKHETEARNSAMALLFGLQKYVRENFENVGARLAEESLKIHYGVERPRNLRGVVTAQEEETLAREGIELLKVPLPISDEEQTN